MDTEYIAVRSYHTCIRPSSFSLLHTERNSSQLVLGSFLDGTWALGMLTCLVWSFKRHYTKALFGYLEILPNHAVPLIIYIAWERFLAIRRGERANRIVSLFVYKISYWCQTAPNERVLKMKKGEGLTSQSSI